MICCANMGAWLDGDLAYHQVSPVCIKTDVWQAASTAERAKLWPGATGAGWHQAFWRRKTWGRNGYQYVQLDTCPFCKQVLQ